MVSTAENADNVGPGLELLAQTAAPTTEQTTVDQVATRILIEGAFGKRLSPTAVDILVFQPELTTEQRRERGIISLPESLGEAIDELGGSDLMRQALGEHIFPRYIELKRKEWDEYRVQVTEWEKAKYLAAL